MRRNRLLTLFGVLYMAVLCLGVYAYAEGEFALDCVLCWLVRVEARRLAMEPAEVGLADGTADFGGAVLRRLNRIGFETSEGTCGSHYSDVNISRSARRPKPLRPVESRERVGSVYVVRVHVSGGRRRPVEVLRLAPIRRVACRSHRSLLLGTIASVPDSGRALHPRAPWRLWPVQRPATWPTVFQLDLGEQDGPPAVEQSK